MFEARAQKGNMSVKRTRFSKARLPRYDMTLFDKALINNLRCTSGNGDLKI